VRRLARVRDPLRGRIPDVAREDFPPTDDVVARIEQERLLAKLVVELEEPYRSVVLQHFYGGLSSAQIARKENVPDATVRTRVRRALMLLRERLARDSGGDPREWPLAAFLVVEKASIADAAKSGVLLMSTKSTLALGVVSGAICAVTVTEGVLPWLETEGNAAAAPAIVARPVAAPAPSGIAARSAQSGPGSGELESADSKRRDPADRSRTAALSQDDLRRMLTSSERIDQVRAIDLLIAERSAAANAILLDAFLGSKDPVLLALLEEAMLGAPLAFAPSILDAFAANEDPRMLARLSGLLTAFAKKQPELGHEVVGHLLGALKLGEDSPERAQAATKALVSLGAGAADELGEFLADRGSEPQGVGSAAWILAQLPAESADLVRETLDESLRSLDEPADGETSEEELTAIHEKTGSIAWASSLRPEAEHDRLSETLLSSFLRTKDPAQAGTFVWSVGNLKGLTEDARVGMTREVIEALREQPDAALRAQYAAMLKGLAVGRPVGPRFDEIVRMAESERSLQGDHGSLAPLLDRLLAELRAYELQQQAK
jgi:Sigma-70, region 4